jgi:plastocyanin
VQSATKKAIEEGDNSYTPMTLAVKKGTTVTWRWPSFEETRDVHDVKRRSGPGREELPVRGGVDGPLVHS